MIVTFLIHSSSRCSVAGVPCTPMLATWPPGRISAVASSNVAGTPTASIATSAPSPPVKPRTTCQRVLAAVVHGDVGAELLGRLEPAVGEVDGDDVAGAEQPGAHDRRQADRAGADDGDDVAGPDVPLSTPTS